MTKNMEEFLDRTLRDVGQEVLQLRAQVEELTAKNASLISINSKLRRAMNEENAVLRRAALEGNQVLRERAAYRILAAKTEALEKRCACVTAELMEIRQGAGRIPMRAADDNRLPPEILDHIFRFVRLDFYHPSILFPDASVTQGSHPPWLEVVRTRKALTLVCRSWSAISTPVLYGEVVFRRMGQICALADTLMLEGRGPYLSQLVRSISLEGCVVFIPCAAAVRDDLGLILRQCSKLNAFSYRPLVPGHSNFPQAHWNALDTIERIPKPEHRPVGINPTWFLDTRPGSVGNALGERLATGLTTLNIDIPDYDFSPPDSPDPMYSGLLPHALHLRTLVLSGCMIQLLSRKSILSLPKLHFPSLITLAIDLNNAFCNYLCTCWEMPHLSALSIAAFDGVKIDGDNSQLCLLFQKHGAALKYLSIPNNEYNTSKLLINLHEIFPVIEHLVISEQSSNDSPNGVGLIALRSPTLRFLDLWSASRWRPTYVGKYVVTNEADVPALELIRLVTCPAKWLGPELCPPELSLAIKPNALGPGPSIYFRLPHSESESDDESSGDESDDESAGDESDDESAGDEVPDPTAAWVEWSDNAVVHVSLPQTRILQHWWGVWDATDFFLTQIPEDVEEAEDAESEYVDDESSSDSDEDDYEDDSDEDAGWEELRQWRRNPGDWMLRDMGPYDHDTIVAMFRDGQERETLLEDSDDETGSSSNVSL